MFTCACGTNFDTAELRLTHGTTCMYMRLAVVIRERDRFKGACEKIMNIRVQDKQIVDAWKEARQIAFDAFDSSGA